MSEKLEVTLVTPKKSEAWTGWVDPTCTAKALLDGLQRDPHNFLPVEPEGYTLVNNRTGLEITPASTFATAGIQQHDVLTARAGAKGA